MAQHMPQYACTLDAEGARARLPQLRTLTERLQGRERHEGQVRLRFDREPRTAEVVDAFVRDEQQCCSFFDFDITRGEDELVLEVAAPTGAGHMLDALMAAFDPDVTDAERINGLRATNEAGSGDDHGCGCGC